MLTLSIVPSTLWLNNRPDLTAHALLLDEVMSVRLCCGMFITDGLPVAWWNNCSVTGLP